MTPIQIVQEEGRKTGRDVSDADADYIVWEHTGFPCYWTKEQGNTPEEYLRTQAREFFEGLAGDGETEKEC